MVKRKFLAISLISFVFLIFGVGFVAAAGQGQPCQSCGQPGDQPCGQGLECLDNQCQYCPPGTVCIRNPLKFCSFEDLTTSIINFIFYIAIAIAPLMVIIAAVYILIAAGDPKKIDTAKNIILYTVIGLAVILLARGLIAIIKQILGVY